MKKKTFYLIILLITTFSFYLRLKDYDKVPPINEAFDEVHYAWGGATWIKNGIPKSWSNFDSYKNVEYLEKYGIRYDDYALPIARAREVLKVPSVRQTNTPKDLEELLAVLRNQPERAGTLYTWPEVRDIFFKASAFCGTPI